MRAGVEIAIRSFDPGDRQTVARIVVAAQQDRPQARTARRGGCPKVAASPKRSRRWSERGDVLEIAPGVFGGLTIRLPASQNTKVRSAYP